MGYSMRADIVTAARENLVTVLDSGLVAADLDLTVNMADGYGLTSLNKVLFLMSVCDRDRGGLVGIHRGRCSRACTRWKM